MPPKQGDIGWEHATPVSGSRKIVKCNYCGKIVHGGITRMKQHIARVSGQVEGCLQVPREVSQLLRQHLSEGSKERAVIKSKKALLMKSLSEEDFYEIDDDESENEIEEVGGLEEVERRQLKQAMKDSREMAWRERQGHPRDVGGSSSQPSRTGIKRGLRRSFTTKEDEIPVRGIDPYMFPSKKKSIKSMFSSENVKRVGKAMAKFFHYNAIPFNAADSGPYYQAMINTIAEAGPGIKGPTGHQIGNLYLEEEMKEVEVYIASIKTKWPQYGCTIMCDGWSSRTRKPIINFMIYCDKNMIYHTSVDTTNISKTADYIFSLMDKVVDEVGEENIVHIVTDNEPSFKAAGKLLMEKRKHLFWSPCAAHCIDLMLEDIGSMKSVKETLDDAKLITSFIYNSLKVVNLMKQYTRDRDLLRPGITRFATEFIAIESLIRYEQDLKRMCTTTEWLSFNKERGRRNVRDKVSNLILTDRFWKKAREVQNVMDPLVRVLKIVDQDKKPTLSIIYEAMDRAKLAIKASNKNWKKYWDVIDKRWEGQLHRHLHAAAYFLNPALQYSKHFSTHPEVRFGLKEVIKRLEPDLDSQARAINEIKLFVDGVGEFGSSLTRRAVQQSLPAEWWINYGEGAPNLQRIAIKVLSQTCSSSGCERNWSTWSLIHTKLRNRLAMAKLHKLVFVHYNMRLRVRNLTYQHNNDDCYNPIDLNHVFNNDDILDEWIQEREQPTLRADDLAWLDEGIRQSEEDQSAEDDDDEDDVDATRNFRRDQGPSQKNKGVVEDSSTSSSDDDEDGGDDGQEVSGGDNNEENSGDAGENYSVGESQRGAGMSWDPNYYATQDTHHGSRWGISDQRRHLDHLVEFSSADDYSSAQDNYSRADHTLEGHMQDLGLTSGGHYGMGYGYDQRPRLERSESTNQTSSSTEYRGFGYYHYGVDIVQPPMPYYSDDGSFTKSSQPIGSHQHSYYYPYEFGFSTHQRDDHDNDFVPHRNSMWK